MANKHTGPVSRRRDFVFEQRRALHNSYRLASHVSLLVRGATSSSSRGRWWALAGASICADLLVGRLLSRGEDKQYALRLLLDAADAAAWVPVGKPDAATTRAAVLIAVPHAVEVGYGIGLSNDWRARSLGRAVAIPVLSTGSAAIMRRFRGLNAGSAQVCWGLLGVAMGALLGRHERLERWRAETVGEEIGESRAAAARLQGQAEIALGGAGGPPHDLKKELLVLASNGSLIAEGAAQELMGRKQHLVERTAPFGAYLGDVISGVSFVPEDAWSVRLTTAQAARLNEEIGSRGRPGVVRLMNEREARRPGGRLVLRLDHRQVELAGEEAPRHWLSDPAPLAFLLSAAWRLIGTIPNIRIVPWQVALPGAAAEVVGMLAYRSAPVPSEPWAPVKASLVSALAYATAATSKASVHVNSHGEQVFPGSGALQGYTLLVTRYWQDLQPNQRRLALGGGLTIGLLPYLLPRRRMDLAAVFSDLPYQLLPCFATLGFDQRRKAQVAALLDDLEQAVDQRVDEARMEGRTSEIALSRAYVAKAEAALGELGDRITSRDAAEIRDRCEEARRWLDNAEN